MAVCARPGCVAEAVDGATLCAVDIKVTRRPPPSAAVYCYACGELIRIGRLWLVRAEGAFHLRAACLSQSPERYEISARSLAPHEAP